MRWPRCDPAAGPRGPTTRRRSGGPPRPPSGSHRPPPARRTFSSGQRALLWAAGILGALAIVIAVLIVVNARGDKPVEQTPSTVTETATESPGAPAAPTDWT